MQLARRIRGHSHLHRYQYDNDRPSIIKPPTTNDASNPVIEQPIEADCTEGSEV